MTALHGPPAAAISAPGLGWHVDITGLPHAGEASLSNGTPVIPVYLGTVAGREVELDITTLAEMDELVHTVQLAHARLSMWVQDHRAHPFGDDETPPGLTGAAA
jgi:hypothetical protein